MLHPTVKRLAAAAVASTALVAATGAAAADALVRPDDRATHGPGAITQTNDWVTSRNVARPDDRAVHGPGATATARPEVVLRPDDRADRRLPNDAPFAQPTSGEGFDWLDAGIGSAATLGLVLLVAGASVLRLRQGAQPA
jgi:hypothetical protein